MFSLSLYPQASSYLARYAYRYLNEVKVIVSNAKTFSFFNTQYYLTLNLVAVERLGLLSCLVVTYGVVCIRPR